MSATELPWFFSESLSARFRQDIDDALTAGHISAQQALWLESLLSEPQEDVPQPRVDRLLREDGGLMNIELAGGLLISDSAAASGEIFFSCVLTACSVSTAASCYWAGCLPGFRCPSMTSKASSMSVLRMIFSNSACWQLSINKCESFST